MPSTSYGEVVVVKRGGKHGNPIPISMALTFGRFVVVR